MSSSRSGAATCMLFFCNTSSLFSYTVSSPSSDWSSSLFSYTVSSPLSVLLCICVECIKDVPISKGVLMPVEHQFYVRFVNSTLKLRTSSLHISEKFNLVHFYLFVLRYSVCAIFISNEVRFVESICSAWIEEICIMYDTQKMSTYCETSPLLAPHW